MTTVAKRVLLILPAYNEEKRIEEPVHKYVAYSRSRSDLNCDYLVVLNGCRDNTKGVVEKLMESYPEVGWMEYRDAIGKGGAVIAGFRAVGDYDWVGFTDADGAIPPDSLFSMLDAATNEDGLVIARRRMQERLVGRRITSFVFNTIVNLLCRLGSDDTQCGGKFFRGSVMHAMLPKLTTCDMAFDVDLLLAAKDVGAKRREHFCQVYDLPGTTIRVFHTSALMFLSVLRLFLMRRKMGIFNRWCVRRVDWVYKLIYKRPRREPPGAPDAVRFTPSVPSPES